jgi:hypothetical protein
MTLHQHYLSGDIQKIVLLQYCDRLSSSWFVYWLFSMTLPLDDLFKFWDLGLDCAELNTDIPLPVALDSMDTKSFWWHKKRIFYSTVPGVYWLFLIPNHWIVSNSGSLSAELNSDIQRLHWTLDANEVGLLDLLQYCDWPSWLSSSWLCVDSFWWPYHQTI